MKPQTHDGQMNPAVQRYVGLPYRAQSSLYPWFDLDLDKQAEGVASASDAGMRRPMELQNPDLETDNDTSSVSRSLLYQQSGLIRG